MAETFNRSSAAIGTSDSTLYTAPNNAAGDRAVVLSALVANIDGVNAATVSAYIYDASNTLVVGANLAKDISVPAGSSLELIANKLILKNGEKLVLSASAAGDLQATASVLEITA